MDLEKIYGAQSGRVEIRSTCDHLPSLCADLTHIPPPDTPCSRCEDLPPENWLCLCCKEVLCSRYVNKHMLSHYGETGHSLSLGLSNLSVWCCSCEAYLDVQLIRELHPVYEIAHLLKSARRNPDPDQIQVSEEAKPQPQPTRAPCQSNPVQPPNLTAEQQDRFNKLKTRTLVPSRWIDIPTTKELGLYDEVKLLTGRVGLWKFLRQEVSTYRDLTLEFLTTVTFDRGPTNTLSFRLGNKHYNYTVNDFNKLMNFPYNDFMNDMTYAAFKENICGNDHLNEQQAKKIQHPTLRYIQRVLAHTLHGRGETQSKFKKEENFFLYCMLRRNNKENYLQPHIGHYMAKHLYHVATEHKSNDTISVGGIITKIAMKLGINVCAGNPVAIPGPTTLDIRGLLNMHLIRKASNHDTYFNIGPSNRLTELPLTIPLDPLNTHTWRVTNEPIVVNPLPAPEGDAAAVPAGLAQPQDGPTNQMIWDRLEVLNNNWTILSAVMAEQFAMINTNVNNHFAAYNTRLDDMQGQIAGMQVQIDGIEDDASYTRWLAQHAYERGDYETEDPPTPPRQCRARLRQ